ncbi:MAG: 16S rRNA (cytosine(967)-C(5))-methyltransferase RsmB [Clostridiales bacterium]|jgi:16S rRNA (cytosine967-C5)-methyltransferase|nr:16S rRNA (cytosine(967)-C(5))-methyltransferase RsmB [Clostridiales bacterium]
MQINQREVIVYALIEILDEKKYNNLVLKQVLAKNNSLLPIQKAFITECVNGTLRNLIHIDYILNFYSRTQTKNMKPFILALLRSSVYQIKFMDKVPHSAVCNEAVNLAKEKGFTNLSGFVNGVLRNIVRGTPKIKYPAKGGKEYLSVNYSIEPWLLEYWLTEYDFAQVESICKYSSMPPNVTACVNTLKIDREGLINVFGQEGAVASSSGALDNSLKIKKFSDITQKESFIKGYFHIMDESSMIAVDALGPKEGSTIIDLCAAPGGKSFYMAYKTNDNANIYCFDVFEHKIELIKKGAKRLGLKSIKAEINNGEVFSKQLEGSADYLLIDAPCSGFGMLRKKPDIKYTKTYDDVLALSVLQKRLIKNSYKYLKDGGILIYSTCTISKKENIDNMNWVLSNLELEPYDISGFIPSQFSQKEKHYVQILPDENGVDGFFIAAFKRKG